MIRFAGGWSWMERMCSPAEHKYFSTGKATLRIGPQSKSSCDGGADLLNLLHAYAVAYGLTDGLIHH
jgi:hypothetical protein